MSVTNGAPKISDSKEGTLAAINNLSDAERRVERNARNATGTTLNLRLISFSRSRPRVWRMCFCSFVGRAFLEFFGTAPLTIYRISINPAKGLAVEIINDREREREPS